MEFYKVKKPIVKELYSFYSNIIPFLGKIINGDSKPYKYLNKSIEDFYTQEQISKKLLNNKFSNIYKEDTVIWNFKYSSRLEIKMIKNIFILFKIGRVLSKSNTLTYFDKIYKIPFF